MGATSISYLDVLAARRAYAEGGNITELLRKRRNVQTNDADIIELAYDIQAGSYVEIATSNYASHSLFTSELATLLDAHIEPGDVILDVGTGEITTLSLVAPRLVNPPARILAFDISWSRIYKGLRFAREKMGDAFSRLTPFVAEMGQIPLPDKSVNVTTSSHALEPNGGRLPELLAELFRVTRDKLVLFEPCYEINSDEGKRRMERLGYIRDLAGVAEQLGGKVIAMTPIVNTSPLNPTACFVITPPQSDVPVRVHPKTQALFSLPGTSHALQEVDGFYFSVDAGLCFPVLKSIPVLKPSAAILASALAHELG